MLTFRIQRPGFNCPPFSFSKPVLNHNNSGLFVCVLAYNIQGAVCTEIIYQDDFIQGVFLVQIIDKFFQGRQYPITLIVHRYNDA